MSSEKLILLGKTTALLSFVFGTCIFGFYFLYPAGGWADIGILYIFVMGIVNLGILYEIIIRSDSDKANRKRLFATAGIMLINIPVVIFYSWMVMLLVNIMRITLTNNGESPLKEIKIVGCEGGYIDKLEQGESKTLWLNITGDCSLYLEYVLNGQKMEEPIADYISRGMGGTLHFSVNGKTEKLRN